MRIRMLEQRTGPRYDGQDWPPYGGEFDVPAEEGMSLCARGSAVPVVVTGVTRISETALDVTTETRSAPEPFGEGGTVPSGLVLERNDTGLPEPVRAPGTEASGPVTEITPPVTETSPAAAEPAAEVAKPIVNAPKSAWVDFAASQGFDRGVAESMTKADLIARFGRDAGAPQD